MAVIDGIGWKKRQSDLRKVYNLWQDQQIDGMYTMATLGQFREDVRDTAYRHGYYLANDLTLKCQTLASIITFAEDPAL